MDLKSELEDGKLLYRLDEIIGNEEVANHVRAKHCLDAVKKRYNVHLMRLLAFGTMFLFLAFICIDLLEFVNMGSASNHYREEYSLLYQNYSCKYVGYMNGNGCMKNGLYAPCPLVNSTNGTALNLTLWGG